VQDADKYGCVLVKPLHLTPPLGAPAGYQPIPEVRAGKSNPWSIASHTLVGLIRHDTPGVSVPIMRNTDGTVDVYALLMQMNNRRFRRDRRIGQLPLFTLETLMCLVKSDNGRHFHAKLRWPMTVAEYKSRRNGPAADLFYNFCCQNPNFKYIALGSPTGYSFREVDAQQLALGMYEGGHLLYHATREECIPSILDRGLLPGGLREGSRNENFFSPVQPQSAREVWKTRAHSNCVVVIDPNVAREKGSAEFL
jgi:RNA:NAD 2'-phosphotransferase (TPT1/KptA family)